MGSIHDSGWHDLEMANHELAAAARAVLCEALGVDRPTPDAMIGSMASIPLPDADLPPLEYGRDPLQDRPFFDHKVEVPLLHWPQWPKRLVRVSAQAYNTLDQYERLAEALTSRLA